MSETRNGKSDFGIFIEKKVKSQSPGGVKLDLIQKSWICEKCQRPEIASPIWDLYQKKIQTHEKVKVSEMAGWISKCCNNRVKCKQGSEQWWARKEKSQTKYWFGLLQKTA